MKNLSCFLLISFFVISLDGYSSSQFPRFFKKCDHFLATYVENGKVNYEAIRKKETRLKDLINFIESADLSKASPSELKCFYINAYNLLVINQIIQNYPVESPFEIEGFYNGKKHVVGQRRITLNYLEEELILKDPMDIRIPVSLCSGTVGSFPLASFAYIPEKMDKQLSTRIRLLTQDENYVRVKKNSSKVLVCEAFIRCQKIAGPKELIAGLNQHRVEAIPNSYFLEFYPSNKALNRAK